MEGQNNIDVIFIYQRSYQFQTYSPKIQIQPNTPPSTFGKYAAKLSCFVNF
jgi:hypothetical protein